jgi:hypothetical protein
VQDQRGDDLARLGVPADEAAAWLAEQDGLDDDLAQPLVVWPENWPVLRLWLRLETQWRLAPNGRVLGLRYEAVEAVMRLAGLKKRRRLFDQLQEMEQEALNAWEGAPA